MFTPIKHFLTQLSRWHWVNFIHYLIFLTLSPGVVFGATASVEHVIMTLQKTFTLVQKLMLIIAFVCGMVFMIIGLLKFKAHKDNPAQIPLSTPIALIAVASGLLFLPTVFDLAGSALFGDAAKSGLPTFNY